MKKTLGLSVAAAACSLTPICSANAATVIVTATGTQSNIDAPVTFTLTFDDAMAGELDGAVSYQGQFRFAPSQLHVTRGATAAIAALDFSVALTTQVVGNLGLNDYVSFGDRGLNSVTFFSYSPTSNYYVNVIDDARIVATGDLLRKFSSVGVDFDAGSTFEDNTLRGRVYFTSFAVRTIDAVPEPATWAMLLIGFGMIGAASRYRRRSIATTFA